MFKLINKRKLDYTNSSPLAHMILYWHLCGTYQWHNECFKRFNSFSNLSRYLSLERFVLSNTFDNFIFSMISMFMGFSRQEYWSGLPFPSPVDHVLSELSTMTHLFWAALHGMAHSFTELDKAVVHAIRLVQFSSVQSLSRVRLFATPWIAAHQASLSITNSRSSPKLMFICFIDSTLLRT